jgi:MFS family permease
VRAAGNLTLGGYTLPSMSSPGRLRSSLRVVRTALGNRSIRATLLAFVLFSCAEWVRWVGLLVYAFKEHGAVGSGLISVIQLVPAALVTPFTSGLADRYPRGKVLAAAYLIAGLGTGGAGIGMVLGLPFPAVAVLAAVGLCGVTMVRPTQASLMPQLADTPSELTAANVTDSLIAGASLFVGPAIATGVLVLWGTHGGVTSGASAVVLLAGGMLLLGALSVAPGHRGKTQPRMTRMPLDPLGGFRALNDTMGAGLVVTLLGLQAAAWGMLDILTVTLALNKLKIGQSGVGLLSAAVGIGGLVGGLATLALVGRKRLAPAFVFGVVLWGVPLAFLGLVGAPLVVVVLLAAAGAGLSFLDVSGRTLLQRTVSDDALGRVFGLLESGYMGAWAVGSSIAAPIKDALGLGWAFAITGGLVPLVTLVWWRRLSTADREAPLPGPELELLRSIDMFAPLAESVLERMARNLTEVSIPGGTSIIREGEPGDLFYVIAEGEVRVTVAGEEVARYGPGHFFGEIALLRDVPRQASVSALTDVRLLTLERTHFLTAVTGSRSASTVANSVIDQRLAKE